MRLDAMLEGCAIGTVPPLEVSGLQYDSRKVRPGEAFFAFPGERVDGHAFVPQALAAGACAIVSEREASPEMSGRWTRVGHGRRALAQAALRFYQRPDRELSVTGVTGTNGKTTTVHLIDSLLQSAGKTTALLGTIAHRVGDQAEKSINTTPESLDVVRFLARLREIGGSHATMEASSHALALERIRGIEFHTAVFTNLTPEHLDFHGDMSAYRASKRRLLEGAGAKPPAYAVTNADDETGRDFAKLGKSETVSYGRAEDADVRARRVESDARGLRMDVETPAGSVRAEPPLMGDFNVENVLAAIAAVHCHGMSPAQIEKGLRQVRPVPGRFETVDEGQPFSVIVDYAHTADALGRVIAAARKIASGSRPVGRVLTLFGCGGDRDRSKREPMGRIAGELSDLAVLTSDNPRSEDPLRIVRDVEVGLRAARAAWTVEPDRRAAIATILGAARRGDLVLIAGKGHETTQTLADRTIEFDDRREVRFALRAMGASQP